ncbi:unnamed protein product [Caenorhabditis angaria]|uniref:Uncharacterized protein n=1 Tax=Caenorhabditis angaria TaxID=860376 RepID=A0A9P1MWN1_9PELO|nr:unnamed protein product [Caenorhabditis angaria]
MSMRKFFDFQIFKSIWFQRLLSIFEKKSRITSTGPSKTVTGQNPVKPAATSNNPVIKREMHSTPAKLASVRIPLIKFIGARLPRPHYDSSSLPPLVVTGNFSAPITQSASSSSSIGPVGKIPRGQGIDWQQLPLNLRRSVISEDEIEAVNTGFSYKQ